MSLCCGAVWCGDIPVLAQAGGNDQKFVDFAAQTDMTEAHLGQMAPIKVRRRASRISDRCW